MRRPVVAGNWKMNKTKDQSIDFVDSLISKLDKFDTEVIISPPFVSLDSVAKAVRPSNIKLASQNISEFSSGAYTGEVSAEMLVNVGCVYTIIGHSERRQYFNETSALCEKKCKIAIENNLIPIYCIGETLEERESGSTLAVIKQQLEEGIGNINVDPKTFIIAYEPVWAIGTGVVATSEQAQEVHQFIRQTIAAMKGQESADQIRILYGGSVKASNIQELISAPDIDGGLVGGACLEVDSFGNIISIVDQFYQ